jgi:hypothetical protein
MQVIDPSVRPPSHPNKPKIGACWGPRPWSRFAAHLLLGLVLGGLFPATGAAQAGSYYAGQQVTLPNTGQQITPLAPTAAQFQTLNPLTVSPGP